MWTLAHEQGIALPVKDWEFDELVTVSDPRGVPDLPRSTRSTSGQALIQSSPLAVGRPSAAWRRLPSADHDARAPLQPQIGNRGGERDLDHIMWPRRACARRRPRVPAGAPA